METLLLAFCTADLGLRSKTHSLKKYGLQTSLSCRKSHVGLLDDILKVAYGNNTFFAEDDDDQMAF